jgi:hypothetical protein
LPESILGSKFGPTDGEKVRCSIIIERVYEVHKQFNDDVLMEGYLVLKKDERMSMHCELETNTEIRSED